MFGCFVVYKMLSDNASWAVERADKRVVAPHGQKLAGRPKQKTHFVSIATTHLLELTRQDRLLPNRAVAHYFSTSNSANWYLRRSDKYSVASDMDSPLSDDRMHV